MTSPYPVHGFRALLVPALSTGTIGLAVGWASGNFAWVPAISEVAGLAAILIASGASAEPILRGNDWNWVERLGLAVASSAAFTVLAGLALHLAALPVTPTNVLLILLATSVVFGVLSWRVRARRKRHAISTSGRHDKRVAIGSLLLLGAAMAAILILRPAPSPPALEVALVDDAGRLVALPLVGQANTETRLRVAVRSTSQSASPVSLALTGDGIRPWTTADNAPAARWTVVDVPLVPVRAGTISAVIELRKDRDSLRLPIMVVVEQ